MYKSCSSLFNAFSLKKRIFCAKLIKKINKCKTVIKNGGVQSMSPFSKVLRCKDLHLDAE